MGGEGCRKFESFVGNLEGPPPEKVNICHCSKVPKQFFAHKKQNNMDSYSKLSKNCKEF